jgi:hypothetical protein
MTPSIDTTLCPPGLGQVTVPLHSHEDPEDFYIVSGTQQVLIKDDDGLQWRDAHAGDYVHVPGGTPHAHRNVSGEPAIELVITTARIGRFFQEIGRPIIGITHPPAPDDLAEFVAAAARYGYNLAIGPFFKASYDFGLAPSATVLADRAEP